MCWCGLGSVVKQHEHFKWQMRALCQGNVGSSSLRNMFMNVAGGISFDIYPTPLFVEDIYSNI